jgi:hypothetical protein
MNRRPADAKILIAVVGALVVLAAFAILTVPASTTSPLSIHNPGRDGAMALQLWVNASGYKTSEIVSWTQLDRVDVLFLLDPSSAYREQDGQQLRNWVQNGHTLIVASDSPQLDPVLKELDLALVSGVTSRDIAVPGAPTLGSPPFSAVTTQTAAYIQSSQPSMVKHLYVGNQPVLASLDIPTGRVWLSSALRPFTNEGLHDPGSARLIANLLVNVPHTATVGFDENGRDFSESGVSQLSLFQWLFTTPPGIGILLGYALTMVYLLSRGRRFGCAIPLPSDRLRRESVEYIYAMANLFRRSGQRAEALKHFDQRLRRYLSQRYGIDPRLESSELVNAIAALDATVDADQIRHLLMALSPSNISEQELVQRSSELDRFLRTLP